MLIVALVVNFCRALSRISGIIDSLLPVLHVSENMKKVFGERPMHGSVSRDR